MLITFSGREEKKRREERERKKVAKSKRDENYNDHTIKPTS